MTVTLADAESAGDLAAIARLFRSYAASLDVDLSYQNFAAELAGLPGAYAPPGGALLLARDRAGQPVGCAALRPSGRAGTAEMKRLYVSPAGRGRGLGRRLVVAVLARADTLGYRAVELDTLPAMREAQALYRAFGFEEIAPYYDTPVAGTVFLRRVLAACRSGAPDA